MLRLLTIGIYLWTVALAGAQDKTDKPDPALAVFYEANRLYNIQVYTLAVEKFREFLRTNPKHAKVPEARYGLALSLYGKEEFAEAEKLFGDLAKVPSNPNLARILLLRGQSLLRLNRPADASAAFAAGSTLKGVSKPIKAQHLAGLAEGRTLEKNWSDVVKAADQFLKLQNDSKDPLVARVRFHLASARHELGQFEVAAKEIGQLIAATGGPDKTMVGQPALFLLAESQRELGNFPEARKYYELARKREGPLSVDALFRLGFVHFQEKRYDDAIRAFETLQKEQPDSPLLEPARLYLGRCFFEKKDFRRADQTLKSLPSAEAAFWRARVLEQDKRIDEALSVLAAGVAKFPKDPLLPDLLFAHGNALMAKENFAKAGENFARVVKSFTEWEHAVDAMRLQAFCLHQSKKYQESLGACERFLASKTERPPARIAEITFLKAENLMLLDRSPEAEAAYTGFVASFKDQPQAAAAQFRIGEIRYRREDWKGAGESLRKVDPGKIANTTLVTQLDFMIGDSAVRLGDDATAERHLAKFVSEKPAETSNRDTARLKLAMVWLKRKDAARASAEFSHLLREYAESPHRPRALLERGTIEYEGNNFPAARASLKELFDRHPDHPFRSHAAHRLGWVALKEKKEAEASGHFQFVTTANAKTVSPVLLSDAHYQLAIIAVQREKYPEARQHLEKLTAAKLAEGSPKLDSVLYYLGHVQFRLKDWPAAVQSYSRVLKEIPDSPWSANALDELAFCEKSRGRPDDAVKRYGELLARFPGSELAGPAAVELAELHYAAGEIDAALGVLGKWIGKLATQDPALAAEASFRLGWCHLRKEAYLEAAKSFEQVLGNKGADKSILPKSAYQAAEARLLLKEYAAATVHYERAAKDGAATEDVREQAKLRLGECFGLLDRWTDSERVFREFAQGFPKSQFLRRSQLGLGWALENQKRFPEAIGEYRKALGVAGADGEKPKDETAARSQFQIGECYLAQKDFDRAIGEFVKVELHYGHPQWASKALLEIGNALTAKGDRASARERFEEVIKRFPDTDAATVAKQFLQQNQ